jgi:hypothetical protein
MPKRKRSPRARTKHFTSEAAEDPIERARAYGVDISQLVESRRLTPDERLRRLDVYAAEVRELRAAMMRKLANRRTSSK